MATASNIVRETRQVWGRKPTHRCALCQKKNQDVFADKYCHACEEYQCGECSSKYHEVSEPTLGHNVIHIDQLSTSSVSVDLNVFDICKHPNKVFEYVCGDHDTLCCSACIIEQHRSCKEVNDISTEARKGKVKIVDAVSVTRELEMTAKTLLLDIKGLEDDVTHQLKQMLKLIDAVKTSVMTQFDDLMTSVESTCSRELQKSLSENQDKTTTSKLIIKEMQLSESFLTSMDNNGTDEQKYIAARVVSEQTAIHNSAIETQSGILYKLKPSLVYSDKLESFLKSGKNLATFRLEKNMLCPEVENTGATLKLVTSVDVKQEEYDTGEPLYSGMDFLPDGRLAVIDNTNKSLIIRDEHLKKLGNYKFDTVRYAVAVVSKEEVAVTSGRVNVLEFLHVNKNSRITLTKTIKTATPFFSISMMNDDTFLVSTHEDKRPMRMINMDGEEKDFNNLPQKTYKRDGSMSVYVRNTDKLILTDRNDHAVFMYDNTDTCVTQTVVKDGRIKEPKGVCAGPGDSIFVCSKGSNSLVQVATLSGRVLGSHKVDMMFPYTVCISQDKKKLAVCNSVNGNRKLQLLYVLS